MTPLEELMQDIKTEFPSFSVEPKESSALMHLINALLLTITFGQNKTFMTEFVTTIGTTVYMPSDLSVTSQMVVLRHERVHMRQKQKYTAFLFAFLYLFFPLPTLFAYFRMKFEMEAYEESMRAELEYRGKDVLMTAEYREDIISYFTGPSYFWTWVVKKTVSKWFDETLQKVLAPQ